MSVLVNKDTKIICQGFTAFVAIGVGVASCISEDAGSNGDHHIGVAAVVWREGGGIGAAGPREIGEAAAGDGDIGLNEISG